MKVPVRHGSDRRHPEGDGCRGESRGPAREVRDRQPNVPPPGGEVRRDGGGDAARLNALEDEKRKLNDRRRAGARHLDAEGHHLRTE